MASDLLAEIKFYDETLGNLRRLGLNEGSCQADRAKVAGKLIRIEAEIKAMLGN